MRKATFELEISVAVTAALSSIPAVDLKVIPVSAMTMWPRAWWWRTLQDCEEEDDMAFRGWWRGGDFGGKITLKEFDFVPPLTRHSIICSCLDFLYYMYSYLNR